MDGSGLALCLLAAVFCLFWTPSAGLKTLHLGSCVITTNLQEMRNGFSEIRDRVVREGGTPQPCGGLSSSLLAFLCPPAAQRCDHRNRQAGDSSPGGCIPRNLKCFGEGHCAPGCDKEWMRGPGVCDPGSGTDLAFLALPPSV